jgi:hypothetical protein
MTDPIATLRASAHDCLTPEHYGPCEVCAALAEFERRARIEARRDAYAMNSGVAFVHRPPILTKTSAFGLEHHEVRIHGTRIGGRGPDYHTALEAALDAAGAP